MSHHADSPSEFLDLENTVERERQPHGPVASAPPPLPAELNTCFAVSGRTASPPPRFKSAFSFQFSLGQAPQEAEPEAKA